MHLQKCSFGAFLRLHAPSCSAPTLLLVLQPSLGTSQSHNHLVNNFQRNFLLLINSRAVCAGPAEDGVKYTQKQLNKGFSRAPLWALLLTRL